MTVQFIRSAFICTCLSALLLAGCSVYRPEIHQGQTLKQEDIEQITVGMNALEVRDILGTPLITDVFNNQRWDYVYSAYDRDRNLTDLARVTIHFEEGVVASIDSDSEMPQNLDHLEAAPVQKKKNWFSSINQKVSDFWKRRKKEDTQTEASE